MKPQNIAVKRKFSLLRLIFPTQCLCKSAFKKQFAHLRKNGLIGRGRGRNKRFWNILNNWFLYGLLCDYCHYKYDRGETIEIMTEKGIVAINKLYPYW